MSCACHCLAGSGARAAAAATTHSGRQVHSLVDCTPPYSLASRVRNEPTKRRAGPGATEAAPTLPALVAYRAPDGTARTGLTLAELEHVVGAGEGELWVDLDTRDPAQVAILDRVFRFHPLAVEDTLNPNSRVKFDEYPAFLFAIVRGVRFEVRTLDP